MLVTLDSKDRKDRIRVLGFNIFNFLFYTLDLYLWKNNNRIIDSVLIVLNCSMARYNGRLHCIVGVLPTCYKRKAATYFYPPGGTGRGN